MTFLPLKNTCARRKAGQPPQLAFFTDAQAAEIEAMAAQIIPTDETPGAREARCLYFIDRALTTFDKRQPAGLHAGAAGSSGEDAATLSGRRANSRRSLPSSRSRCSPRSRRRRSSTLVRTHTVIGFFARPEHGGNHDKVGWKLIGYDDSLNHKPPFGYYDAHIRKPPAKA